MPFSRRTSALLALGIAVAGAARAGAPAGSGGAPWTIDRAASRVTLRARIGGQPVQGVFKRWTAEVAPGGKVSLTVENASLVTGDPARDRLLTGPQGLAAARFKTSGFAGAVSHPCAGRVAGDCPGGNEVAGVLRVRDARRPAVLRATVVAAGKDRRLEAMLPIDAALVAGLAAQGLDTGSLVIEARLARRLP